MKSMGGEVIRNSRQHWLDPNKKSPEDIDFIHGNSHENALNGIKHYAIDDSGKEIPVLHTIEPQHWEPQKLQQGKPLILISPDILSDSRESKDHLNYHLRNVFQNTYPNTHYGHHDAVPDVYVTSEITEIVFKTIKQKIKNGKYNTLLIFQTGDLNEKTSKIQNYIVSNGDSNDNKVQIMLTDFLGVRPSKDEPFFVGLFDKTLSKMSSDRTIDIIRDGFESQGNDIFVNCNFILPTTEFRHHENFNFEFASSLEFIIHLCNEFTCTKRLLSDSQNEIHARIIGGGTLGPKVSAAANSTFLYYPYSSVLQEMRPSMQIISESSHSHSTRITEIDEILCKSSDILDSQKCTTLYDIGKGILNLALRYLNLLSKNDLLTREFFAISVAIRQSYISGKKSFDKEMTISGDELKSIYDQYQESGMPFGKNCFNHRGGNPAAETNILRLLTSVTDRNNHEHSLKNNIKTVGHLATHYLHLLEGKDKSYFHNLHKFVDKIKKSEDIQSLFDEYSQAKVPGHMPPGLALILDSEFSDIILSWVMCFGHHNATQNDIGVKFPQQPLSSLFFGNSAPKFVPKDRYTKSAGELSRYLKKVLQKEEHPLGNKLASHPALASGNNSERKWLKGLNKTLEALHPLRGGE
jgi:hypothetical protein